MNTPTKSRVLGWDVTGLDEVADTIDPEGARAGIESGLDAIRSGMRRAVHDLDWSGAACAAALGRADAEWTGLGRVIDAYSRIGSNCRAAARAMAYPVGELRALVGVVENAGGAVSDSWEVTGLPDPDENADTTLRLRNLAADLDRLDARWAPAIAAAVLALRAMAPASAALGDLPARPGADRPAADADIAATRAWWDSLTGDQRGFLVTTRPQLVGALDGLPAAARDRANRSLLDYTERELRTQLAQAGSPQARLVARTRLDDLRAVRSVVETTGTADSPRLLLSLDASGGERVKAVVAIGDPDTANHVAVTTPGLNTNATDSLARLVDQAHDLRAHARELLTRHDRGDRTVATIAWLGYEPPQRVSPGGVARDPVGALAGVAGVVTQHRAENGARALADFYEGLDIARRASGNADAHVTALGHSYGSTTTSLALRELRARGVHAVDDVVLYGSPGLGGGPPGHDSPRTPSEIVDGDDYGLPPGHTFTMATPDDAVARLNRFGWNPVNTPGWIPLETGASVVGGAAYGGAAGHSDYPRFDDGPGGKVPRTSAHNLAAVLTGLESERVAARPR
ncbi:alpha/beta hydrolase [Nocardia thailandica]